MRMSPHYRYGSSSMIWMRRIKPLVPLSTYYLKKSIRLLLLSFLDSRCFATALLWKNMYNENKNSLLDTTSNYVRIGFVWCKIRMESTRSIWVYQNFTIIYRFSRKESLLGCIRILSVALYSSKLMQKVKSCDRAKWATVWKGSRHVGTWYGRTR